MIKILKMSQAALDIGSNELLRQRFYNFMIILNMKATINHCT